MPIIKYVCGNPASGKTTFINKFYKELVGDGFLLDYNNYKDWNLLNSGYTSQQIHDISVEKGTEDVKSHIYKNEDIVFECTMINMFFNNLRYNMQKLKNRGYITELYMIIDDKEDSLIRNKNRIHPAPDNLFLSDSQMIFSSLQIRFDFYYAQKIEDINVNKIYDNQTFYKGFKKEQQLDSIISVEGKIERDKNAIYYANNENSAKLYGDFIYEVIPIGDINRYYNTFYSSGVRLIKC